jgi:hypothetical protein
VDDAVGVVSRRGVGMCGFGCKTEGVSCSSSDGMLSLVSRTVSEVAGM